MTRLVDDLRPYMAATILAASLVIGGCESNFTTGAASMRVDVEVYKGPLSKQMRTQIAELDGLLQEADDALLRQGVAIATMMFSMACPLKETNVEAYLPKEPSPSPTVGQTIDAIYTLARKIHPEPAPKTESDRTDQGGALANQQKPPAETKGYIYSSDVDSATKVECLLLTSLLIEAAGLLHDTRTVTGSARKNLEKLYEVSSAGGGAPNPRPELRVAATRVSALAQRYKVVAAYWQASQITLRPTHARVRTALTAFEVTLAEFSNQINGRADALLKQLEGIDRNELPLSTHLRDAGPTDFLQLFDWNDATVALGQRPSRSDVQERIRVFERLHADNSWSRINTVYAGGQGEVAMAFVKDDIGNWSLKQFDNDPADLLAAYRETTMAAISTAASAIAGGNVGTAKQLLNLADGLAFGSGGSGGNGLSADLGPARAQAAAQMKAIEDQAKAAETAIASEPDANRRGNQLKLLREATAIQVKGVLDSYRQLLSMVEATPMVSKPDPLSMVDTAKKAVGVP